MIRLPLFSRILFAVPVIGWMLKDVIYGRPENKWYFLGALVSCWIMAIMAFGYPAVIIPVICAVPLAFFVLLMITRG